MHTLADAELLAAYASQGSEAAFATLVDRHLSLVYSAARRQAGTPHDAEDITQAVFILLARKAATLRRETVLAAWLCRTVHLTACNARKTQYRRHHREWEAHMHAHLNEPEPDAWPQIAPLLDAAVARLSAADRNAVVLRFYQQQTLEEVGRQLGLNADAAQKRVSRALEKLRKLLGQRGAVLSAMALMGALSAHSVSAAPAGLSATISAVAITQGAAAGTSTLTLVKGALKIMAWTKMKTAVIIGAGVLLAAATTTIVAQHLIHPRLAPARIQVHTKARFYEVPENFQFATTPGFPAPAGHTAGILTSENLKKLIQSLAANGAAEELGAPEVTTSSGRQCQMRTTSTITVVTNLVLLETNATPSIAPQTGTVETGPILDLTATVAPDGKMIELKLSAAVTEFEGYDHTTNTTAAFTAAGEQVDVPVIAPRVWTLQANATVKIRDDETVILGGLPVIQVRAQSTLPNPLDPSATQPLIKKQLLILITATLVDAAGNRIH